MAIIPAEEKVFMVSNSTNTTYSGSAALKAMQQWYTMQDVIDTVGGGGTPTLQQVTDAGSITSDTITIENTEVIGAGIGLSVTYTSPEGDDCLGIVVDATGFGINATGGYIGGYFYSPEGTGIVAQSDSGTAITAATDGPIAISASNNSNGTGIYASSVDGTGIQGYSENGVAGNFNSQENIAVYATSENGMAIYGYSDTEGGVYGASNEKAGVSGNSNTGAGGAFTSIDNYGVYGGSTESNGGYFSSSNSPGVWGFSTQSYGARFSSATTYSLVASESAAKPGGGSWSVFSDSRIKENVTPYTKGLAEILLINTVTYEYNGLAGTAKGAKYTGIIAQEIKEIFPETVSTYKEKLNEEDEEKTELYDFNASDLTFALINAVKELKAEIDLLKAK